MKEINPSMAYFIKLGGKGKWEDDCFKDGTIRLGFADTNHRDCLAGRWKKVKKARLQRLKKEGKRGVGKATETTNEIQKFYESGEDVLWVTFCGDLLWWCFAKNGVRRLSDGSKIRNVKVGWSSTDIHGNPLSLEKLSGKLVKTRGFRGTICRVNQLEYVRDRINGKAPPKVQAAKTALESLRATLAELIEELAWKDFELFAQLIFTSAGWQKVGVTGGTQKAYDLVLQSPVTNERTAVQVKSSFSSKQFEACCREFSRSKDLTAFYYVTHSSDKSLESVKCPKNVRLILADKLAELAINAGLVSWLIEKNS